MRFRASEVAVATGGRVLGADVELDGAAFDSREVRPGQLFVPLVAARDGHAFIADAVDAGARAYLHDRLVADEVPAVAIEVVDTATALIDLATALRGRLTIPVVGVTGSVGKTSTKDLIAAALRLARRVHANERSFNNEQGLPVTILATPPDAEVVITEMGMRGFGQIADLCRIAQPTIGVVTSVGEAHTELVGGIDGVAVAKRELVESLPASGTAVLNADDHRVAAMARHTRATVITYGHSGHAEVRIRSMVLDEFAQARCVYDTPWGRHEVALAVSGAHMALNAAAALAVAGVSGVDLAVAAAGLEQASVSSMRMQRHRLASGAVILDDSYNANPTSMRAAFEALVAIRARRRIAVLGEMAELDDPAGAHRHIAELASDLGIEVIVIGTTRYGLSPVEDPVEALGKLGSGDVVLFKGSRVVGLDVHVRRLLDASSLDHRRREP